MKRRKAKPESYTRPFTAQELQAIRDACGKLKTLGAQHKALALVSLMEATGMRISDASMLRRDAITQEGGEYWLSFRAIKNGRKVLLTLPAEAAELLNTLPGQAYFFHSERSQQDRTIFRMGRLLSRVFKLSGVEGAHSHRYRHYVASKLGRVGKDIRTISEVLGDTPAIAERHYLHHCEDHKQKMREAMEAIR